MNSSGLNEVKDILRSRQFSRLFSGDTDNTFIQFFRYLFVGGLAAVVDWGVSYILFRFVFHEQSSLAMAANGISFVAGLAVNYLLSTFWIFKNSNVKSRLSEFLVFAAIGLVGLLLTIGITKLFELWLSDTTSAFQIIAKIVSTGAAFFWNFFARKIILYSNKKKN